MNYMVILKGINASHNASVNSDIFFIVGTSAIVFPAASLIYAAKQSRSYLIEINIEETEISPQVNFSMFGKAGKILPEILEKIKMNVKKL
jgi:NAD-dependent protein deacetylase/lipoamidase